MKQSIYIIIPVHNRKTLTLACLENLQISGDLQKYYVIVVDDGSSDHTSEEIASNYPEVTVLKGDGNLWWTGAIKLGMEYAYQQGAEYIIWLNDDVIPQPNTLPLLIEFLQNHPHSIVAPTCLDDNHHTVIPNGCIGRTPIIANPNQVTTVHSVSGYCVAFPAKICETIGYPDAKKYPHYGGDDMYTLQAHRQGFTIYLLGEAKVQLVNYQPSINKQQLLKYTHHQLSKTINLTFFTIKSPFYLPSQYHYLSQKYNIFLGSLLFTIKLTGWLLYLLTHLLFKPSHHEPKNTP